MAKTLTGHAGLTWPASNIPRDRNTCISSEQREHVNDGKRNVARRTTSSSVIAPDSTMSSPTTTRRWHSQRRRVFKSVAVFCVLTAVLVLLGTYVRMGSDLESSSSSSSSRPIREGRSSDVRNVNSLNEAFRSVQISSHDSNTTNHSWSDATSLSSRANNAISAKASSPPSFMRSSVDPLWACSDSSRTRRRRGIKLAFVHVFKAAGSTISTLFRSYSQACHTGYARLISCTSVVPETMVGNGTWRHCHMKHFTTRDGGYIRFDENGKANADNVNNTFLDEELDIVGGHFRIGSVDHLSSGRGQRAVGSGVVVGGSGSGDGAGQRRGVQYITFVRDAASKFVSGVIYSRIKHSDGKTTGGMVLTEIRDFLLHKYKRKYYHNKYAHYLLTPSQMLSLGELGEDERSVRRATDVVLRNLDEYNVLVGVVERMSESLELLHHVLDSGGGDETRDIFASFGMMTDDNNTSVSTSTHASNKSPVSTAFVIKLLRADANVSRALDEYVKYEQMITNYALGLHMKQYEQMREQKLRLAR